MSREYALEVTDVSIRFGGIQAMKNVDLSVEPGKRVGLIGPNGAGKTTLINCVAGSLRPNQGDVRLFGESIVRMSAERRSRLGVGRTFQNLELFNSMSVLDNIRTALHHTRSKEKNYDLVGETIEAFKLEQYINTPAGMLPFGIQKLVELTRAFVREPRFLLLDEPVAGLSEPESFLETLISGLDRLQCAVLLVEHDMPTVRDLCSEVYVLDSGRMIAHGTYSEVTKDQRVVDAYLGAEIN